MKINYYRNLIIIVILLLSVNHTGVIQAENNDEIHSVSIINLIANPDKYHGKKVFLTGWFNAKFENVSLCLLKEEYFVKECVWVYFDNVSSETKIKGDTYKERLEYVKRYDGSIVSMHATFDMSGTGHLGTKSGGLKNITAFYPKTKK